MNCGKEVIVIIPMEMIAAKITHPVYKIHHDLVKASELFVNMP